jgi:hypothetical protein
MQQSLLDRLVELMKLDTPEEWARLCHHAYATQPKVTCWTRGRCRLRIRDLPTAKDWLDQLANLPSRSPEKAARKCLRNYRRADPRASTDTLLTDWLCWNCVQRFADVYRNQMVGRIKGSLERKPAPLPNPSGAPINKLMGKQWVAVAFERRRNELRRLPITQAGSALAEESNTASGAD